MSNETINSTVDVPVLSTEVAFPAGIAQLPEHLQKKLRAYAEMVQRSTTASIQKIRLDAKAYIFDENHATPTFEGVIVAFRHANVYYDQPYREGVINAPACFAVGTAPCDTLKPHPLVVNPPHHECATCPKFAWGSALTGGRGKACAEHTLLAVCPLEFPEFQHELFVLEAKRANSRAANEYLARITRLYGAPVVAYTRFTIGQRQRFEQQFALARETPLESNLLQALASRIEEAEYLLEQRLQDLYRTRLVQSSLTPEDDTPDRAPRFYPGVGHLSK